MKKINLADVNIGQPAIKKIAKTTLKLSVIVAGIAILSSCASPSMSKNNSNDLMAIMKASFIENESAKLDRLDQSEIQKICSEVSETGKDVDAATRKRIETTLYANIPYPTDAKYIGDWKEGEKIAQNGRGLQFSDKVDGENGANCYACHQMSPKEISYGNLGPSLLKYGTIRGVKDPSAKESEAIVKYTWARLWNTHSVNLCSNMPRFGDAKILTTTQLKDVMALLLDPQSPVNK